MKRTRCEAPHYAVFSSHFLPLKVQILSSAPSLRVRDNNKDHTYTEEGRCARLITKHTFKIQTFKLANEISQICDFRFKHKPPTVLPMPQT